MDVSVLQIKSIYYCKACWYVIQFWIHGPQNDFQLQTQYFCILSFCFQNLVIFLHSYNLQIFHYILTIQQFFVSNHILSTNWNPILAKLHNYLRTHSNNYVHMIIKHWVYHIYLSTNNKSSFQLYCFCILSLFSFEIIIYFKIKYNY